MQAGGRSFEGSVDSLCESVPSLKLLLDASQSTKNTSISKIDIAGGKAREATPNVSDILKSFETRSGDPGPVRFDIGGNGSDDNG